MKMRRSILAPLAVGGIALATGGWFLQRGVNQAVREGAPG